ncbi:TcfC E-set like domain-containing protein [Pusillimonas sp. SM2304]|uniref:TcfC E-set like domain-containing protein n=1 Tax=Pusillimonas sp. SM2304 TaxID=3073241 RepID=UPI002876B258|nr:TcfC E-set like domain-containing protein [Pusillimonas sp. SM2304]MDS1138918.1 TcfC E-set like domain-containing protein [Pusillimonas sp. SM2304]
MDNSARYVATFNGKTLPGLISYSLEQGTLVFDSIKYAENGVSIEEQQTIRKVLSKVDYKLCNQGCDIKAEGHYVSIDKQRRTLNIRDSQEDYLRPTTTWGLVNNQSLDLRASSDRYRAMNVSGNTWMGLPFRGFGYMNWYANRSRTRGNSNGDQGISSYFLQKNFAGSYVRAGKQNSLDYASGAVSTLLSPSFDHFVTFGSQEHLRSDRDVGSLVLFSTSEGNYEFYRNGRLILKRPAILGRNEFSYIDLPGGYYPVEIRLVDRNGNVVNRETRDINNLNFSSGGGNSWHITAGKDMEDGGQLFQVSASRNLSQFYMNASVVAGNRSRWAGEVNATRPMRIGSTDLVPTVGILSGERGTGGYFNLTLNDDVLGNLSASRYQSTQVSRFYLGAPSTTLSYSRNVKGTVLAYNYQKHSRGETQQAEVRWNYHPNGLWSTFSLGVQKGGYMQRGGYAVYFNMTWMLDKTQASFRAAQYGGQTQLSGDYRKDFQDSYGTSTAGVTVSRLDQSNSINAYGSRSGTRGDATLNVGNSAGSSNVDFNYRGMVAANAQGGALGRYSPSGSAMLLSTPDISGTPYGFNVEGHPVAGGSTYAVPLSSYNDVAFARVLSSSEDMDMNIEVPANIVRAHPGQVYSAQAKVDINMVYSGILVDGGGKPVGGRIMETGDTAYPNGLFSIASKAVLASITVEQPGRRYICDLTNTISDSLYRCK